MAKTFSRGLKTEFVAALNQAYGDQDSWWKKLVDDNDLYIGIRGNYLNVYFNGGSILELKYNKAKRFLGNLILNI